MKATAPQQLLSHANTIAFLVAAILSGSVVVAADVPMIDEGVMLRIAVTVFNETHFFLLDSGASTTVIDETLRERLGSPIGEASAQTPFNPRLPASLYPAPDISIGNTAVRLKEIARVDLHMARLITGEPCSGVLGMDVVSRYVVSLDFNRNRLQVSPKPQSTNKLDSMTADLATIGENRFGIETILNGNHRFTLLIDSGASESVSLNKCDWQQLFGNSAETVGRTSQFTGAGNTVRTSRIARLGSLRVGATLYTNVLCNLLPNPSGVSRIGLAFLRQNSVVFDFPNRQIHLARRTAISTEEDDMSGLHLLRVDGATVIFSVDVGSPAEIAGLRAGDKIVAVNRKPASALKMKQIRDLLQEGDGKQVDIAARHDGKEYSTKVTLKRSI